LSCEFALILRFFTATDNENDLFGLFVEAGVSRHVECHVVGDHDDKLELTVEMPLPPDALLPFAGFRAVAANLHRTNESFVIPAPARLRKESKRLFVYPNVDLPLWHVFRYELEETTYDAGLEVDSNMEQVFKRWKKNVEMLNQNNNNNAAASASSSAGKS
jgi:hypothetical protein